MEMLRAKLVVRADSSDNKKKGQKSYYLLC